MANRYWVGGTGTWTTTTTNWSASSGGASGASAPTSADSVFFDQAGTYTVTMTGTLNCLDITVSAGTVTFTSTGTLNVAGSMTLSANTVWSATGTLTFSSTAIGRTITTNNITINAATVTFNGSGGAWTLGSNFTTATTSTTSYLTGTLNLVTFTWSTGIFSSSSALTRVISFGSGNIALTSTAGATVLNMTDAAGFSWTGTGGFTSAHGAANGYRFYGTNANATTAPNLSITGGSAEILIISGSYFKKLDFTGNTSIVSGSTTGSTTSLNLQSLTLAGGTYTNLTAALMIAGGTIVGASKTIASLNINTGGTTTLSGALTVTGTTTLGTTLASALDLNGNDLTTGSFSASSALTRSIAFGVNFIIATTSGVAMADMTNFTWTGSTGGFKGNMATSAQTFNLGSTSGVTATNAVNLYIYTGTLSAFLTTLSRFNKVDCTGSTSTVNCSSSSTPGIVYFNSLILASGGTYTTIQASMVGDASGGTTSTINGNGTTTLNTIFIAAGITTTLTSALGLVTYTQVTNTTLNTAGFALTASSTVTYTGGTLTLNGSTLSCTTFTFNGPTFVHNSGTINCSTGFTMSSGSFTLGTLGNLGAIPTFTHNLGTVIFLKSTAFAVAGQYTFNSGTLNVSGVTLSVGVFTSSSDLSRTLTFGTGFIDITTTTADAIALTMTAGANFSCTGAGGFSSSMNNSRKFRVTTGHTVANAPNLFITGGASNVLIYSSSVFSTIDFTGSTSTVSGDTAGSTTSLSLGSITLASGGTYALVTINQQITGTISGNGRTIASLNINVAGLTTTLSTALTVTGNTTWGQGVIGTLILSADLTTGGFNSSATSVRSISFGANYIVMTSNGLSMAAADNFTWTGTGGFKGNMTTTNQSFNFGSSSGGSASNAPNILIYTGAFSAFLTASGHFKTVDCTGSTSQVNASSSTTLGAINVYDSVVLASGGTYPFLQLDMKSTTNTINGNGRILGTFTIASGSTTTLLSALTINTAYTQVTGTTLSLSTFTLTQTAGIFTYTGGTLSMGTGTISCLTFTFNGPTFTLNSGTINCSTTFNMTSGSFTLGTLGTLGAIPTFNHTAGTVTFLKSTTFTNTGTYTFSSGTLDVSAGVTLSVGTFSSSTDLSRTLTFGTGFIDVTNTVAEGFGLTMTAGANFSCTGAGGFTSSMNNSRRFRVTTGHTIANAPNLFITGGASNVIIDSSSVFTNINFTGSTSTVSGNPAGSTTSLSLGSITLASGGTYSLVTINQQITGTISGNGRTIASLNINVAGLTTTLSTALTVTGNTTWGQGVIGTLILSADLTTGGFNSSATSVRSISFGANYIVMTSNGLSMAAADNFTYTGAGGFKGNMTSSSQTFNFGSSSGGSASNAPILLIYTGANTAGITAASYFKTIDCTGSTSTVNSTGVNVNALTLAAGGTYTAFTAIVYGTSSINGNGKTIVNFTFFGTSDTCNFQSALAISGSFVIGSTNTLNLATFAFTVTGSITCNTSSSIINFGTTSCTTFTIAGPNITVNSGSLNCTSFTINSGTYTLGASGAMAATVGTFTHTAGNVTFLKSYALTTTGTYTFTAGTLTITGFTLSTGIFSSNNANVRSLIINTGFISLTHTSTVTIISMADTTNLTCTCTTGGFTVDASIARTFTFGTTGGTVDNVANLTFTGSGTGIPTLTTTSWFRNLSFGTTAFTMASTALNLSGFALAAGGTYTAMNITLRGSDNNTVNGNARTIGPLTINKTGTTTFQSALSCSTFTQTAGDVNFATFNLTCSSTVAFTSGTYTNMGVLQCTTFTLTGTFVLSSGTLTPTVSFVLGSGIFVYQAPATLSAVATFTHSAGSATFSKAYALTTTGTYTLTAGDIVLNGADLTTGIFSSDNTNSRSITFDANNIILTHTTASTTVVAMANASNFTLTATTGGFTANALVVRVYNFGSSGAGASTTNAPNLTFTGSGTAIPVLVNVGSNGSYFNKLDFGATAFILGSTLVNINAITLSVSSTYTALTFTMRGTGLITTNNKPIAGLTLDTIGTNTLAGNVTCTSYTQTAGAINLAGFNIICSGAITVTGGTMSNSGTITCTTFTVNGTFSLDSGTITPSVSVVILSGTFTYNSGGTLSPVPTFTHTDGTFTLGKAYALTATGTYTFTAGTLNLGGFNLTTGIFNSSSTSTRSIVFGANNIILAHTSVGQTVLGMADSTSFSNTGTGGFTSAMTVARTFTFGTTGGAFNIAPNLSIISGVEPPTITSNSWFKTLNFTGSSTTPTATTINVDTLTLSSGGTYTGLIPQFTRSQTWTSQFSKQLGGIGINALFNTLILDNTQTYITTSVCSVVAGTLNLGGADLTIGSFSSTGTLTRSVIFGSNNIILSTPTAGVTVLSVADATNFSCSFVTGGFVASSALTRTFSFGSTAGGTSLSAPNLTINSGSAIPTITTGSWFNILDFTGSSCTPAVATVNVSSAILSSGGTFTNLSLSMRSNGSITPLGKTISAFVVNHSDFGTTTIVSTLNCTTQTYTAGNVDFGNNNVTSSAGAAYSSGAFSNINTITCTTFTITGTFLLTQGTITPSVSIILTSGSITYNGGTISAVPTFTHTSGTFILGQAYALTATGTYTFTGGSIVLNGYNLTTGIFSSTGIVSRSISFSTGNINLTHTTAAQTVLNMADVTNFTQSATTGGFVSNASVTRTFTFGTTGGTVTNAPNLAITTGSAVPTITNLSWFNTLNFDGSSTTPPSATLNISTLTLSVGGTYTGLVPVFTRTQTWTAQFSKPLGGIGFNLVGGTLTLDNTQTYIVNSQCILTAGTINLGGADLNAGTFSSNNSNVRSLVLGTNSITLTTVTAAATNLDMATATNFTISGTGGFIAAASTSRTFSFGSTAGGTATNSPNLTFTSGSSIQTITTASWFNKLDFGTTAFAASAGSLNLNSLTLSSGGSFVNLVVTMVGSGTIISNGATNLQNLTVSGTGITTTLGSAFTLTGSSTATGNVQLDAGTLALAGFILTCNRFLGSQTTNNRSISFGTGNIALASTLAGTVVLSFSDATNFTWTGTGGFTTIMSVSRTFSFGNTAGGSTTNAPNLSITSGASAPTLTSNGWFKNLNFNGSTCTPAGTINVDTLTLDTGGTYTGLAPVFTRTQTWTVQFSKQLNGIGVNGSGVTLTLSAGQTYTATSQCFLTLGTIDLGGSNLTIGTFSSNNSNVRSLVLGTNNIILSTTSGGTNNLDMATATNFTISGTGGFTAAADITRTFTFGTTGGSATNSPTLTFTGTGTAVQTITTGSWFNYLDFFNTEFALPTTSLNLNNLNLNANVGASYVNLTATMVGSGLIYGRNKFISALTINHNGTTQLMNAGGGANQLYVSNVTTLTSGTFVLNGTYFQTGTFSSSNSNTRAIAFDSVYLYLVTGTAGVTNLSMATASGFSCSGTGGFYTQMTVTRTFNCGTATAPTVAPSLFIASGASIPTITTGSWFNTLNFTGSTCTPAATNVNLNNLILASGGTYSSLTATMVGTGTITSNARSILALTINHTGTTTLADALDTSNSSSGITTLTSGTLNLANFTLSTGVFVSSNTNTRSITFGTGNISLGTTSSGTYNLSMADATNFTWTGTGGFTSTLTAAGVTRLFAFGSTAGGSATNAPNLSLTLGSNIPGFQGGSWFKTLNFTGTTSTPSATTIYVDTLTLATGGTYTALIPVFTRTQTWTAQFSKQLGGIGVNGSGVTLTLDGTQTYTATSVCYLTQGTLNLGGVNQTFGSFSSSNTNTRAIVFGSNNIILATTTSGATNLDMANTFNFTYTGTGGFVAAADRTRTFAVGTVGPPVGGDIYSTPGTYSWTAPAGVTSVDVVAVGAGGGGYSSGINTTAGQGGAGGGLGWKNNIAVTPGQSYTVFVGQGYRCTVADSTKANNGEPSYFINLSTVAGLGGESGDGTSINAPAGGGYVGDGGGNGGSGAVAVHRLTQGAGGAGGYSGNGGNGGVTGIAGSGGGGGGTSQVSCASGASGSGSGGGVGIYGEGASGAAGTGINGGGGGSSGVSGGNGVDNNTNDASTSAVMLGRSGGLYGGGGGAFSGSATPANSAAGANGAVRIIWGENRSFPSTNVSEAYEAAAEGAGSTITPANAINLSFTGSGTATQTIVTGSTIKNLNFGTTGFTIPSTIVNVDTLTLSSSGTYNNLTPVFTRTQTWTTQFSKPLNGIGVDGTGVTLTLEATQPYIGATTLIVNAGTLAISNLNLTFNDFISTGLGARSITGTGSITILNNWTVTYGLGFTGSTYSIKMAKATVKTFAGGGGSYGILYQSNVGTLTITGSNTFADIIVGSSIIAYGQQAYITAGTYSWVAPTAVNSVCVVCIGGAGGGMSAAGINGPAGGGGGGGGLGWKNSIAVTPGNTYTVVVGASGPAVAYNGTPSTGDGGQSYFISAGTVAGNGGAGGTPSGGAGGAGGTYVGDGGGNGGQGGISSTTDSTAGGGGGGAGYAGNGGDGADTGTGNSTAGSNGGGGGGGSGSGIIESSGGGGGVGILGQGTSGLSGTGNTALPGSGGSGGASGLTGATGNPDGGLYGGGGGGQGGNQGSGLLTAGAGANGAVRIIWGPGRAYPSTNTTDA